MTGLNYRIESVAGGGNCFFNSIGVLTSTNGSAHDLRFASVRHIANLPADESRVMYAVNSLFPMPTSVPRHINGDIDLPSYTALMSQTGTSVGLDIVFATGRVLDRAIAVYNEANQLIYLTSTLDFDLPPLFLRFTVLGSSDQGHFEPIITEDRAITSQTSHGARSGHSVCVICSQPSHIADPGVGVRNVEIALNTTVSLSQCEAIEQVICLFSYMITKYVNMYTQSYVYMYTCTYAHGCFNAITVTYVHIFVCTCMCVCVYVYHTFFSGNGNDFTSGHDYQSGRLCRTSDWYLFVIFCTLTSVVLLC